MAIENQKLIGQLSLGLETLRTNVKDANKILEGISTKKLNLDIIDEKTKNKLIETAKIIKKEIENIGKTGADTSQTKILVDAILKSFNSIQIKAKEMQPVITETFKSMGNNALESAKNQEIAANKVSTSYDKSGKKVVENLKAMYDAEQKFSGYNPTSKVTTDDSSAKLNQIKVAYQRLAMEGKTSSQSLLGMANEVQKTTEKYGLLGNALTTANTQQLKYRNEAQKLTQMQAQQASTIAAEAQARVTAANKVIAANEKQALSTLSLYTKETAALSKYDKMSRTLAAASGEAGLAMSSSNSGASVMDRFKISGIYAFAAQSIFMLRQGIRDLIQTNKDYESSLVDLGRVLGDVSKKELELFGQQAINNAKEYGLALKEVQDSYTALAKAGVGKGDLESMVKTISLGLNTSNIKSGQELAELLTTSMKQMNIEFSESEKILDGWNYLADKTVADTGDFAQAISKSGSAAKAVGVDINELNGIVSVLIDKTGMSGSAAGTNIQSLTTRLLRPEALDTLKKYNIEVMDGDNKFKSFGEIIKATSTELDKFGEMTVQSNEILDALGGSIIHIIMPHLYSNVWMFQVNCR